MKFHFNHWTHKIRVMKYSISGAVWQSSTGSDRLKLTKRSNHIRVVVNFYKNKVPSSFRPVSDMFLLVLG